MKKIKINEILKKCPKCGSKNIHSHNIFYIIYICMDCDYIEYKLKFFDIGMIKKTIKMEKKNVIK